MPRVKEFLVPTGSGRALLRPADQLRRPPGRFGCDDANPTYWRRFGRTDYELFEQIWLSPDLADKQTGAFIQRRTSRGGDATDHDPAVGVLRL